MSIGSIGSDSSWYWQTQATQAAQATAATATTSVSSSSSTGSGDAVANSGSPAASNNFASFLQAFSADLQAMLTQLGNAATTTSTPAASSSTTGSTAPASSASTATTSTTTTAADPTSQTASTQDTSGVHHHHHHHGDGDGDGDGGQGGSMQTAANQLVGDIGESLQTGSQTASGINNSASTFATDMVQAMQAYGGSTSTSASLATLV
jgi:hypothetical protein